MQSLRRLSRRSVVFTHPFATSQQCSTSLHRFYSSTDSSTIPRVASTSLWHSVIPKAFRQPNDPVSIAERQKAKVAKRTRSKEWNPATFFILIALLIGSNAIQLISLRNQMLNYSRKTEAKIALLREVIQRVQDGEDVDVERELGKGDLEKEREWEEVMKEITSEDTLWQTKKSRRGKKVQGQVEQEGSEQSAVPAATGSTSEIPETSAGKETSRKPGFY